MPWLRAVVAQAGRALLWPPQRGDGATGALRVQMWGIPLRQTQRAKKRLWGRQGRQAGGSWRKTLRVFSPAGPGGPNFGVNPLFRHGIRGQWETGPKLTLRNVSDLEIVGCKLAAAVHFSPSFCRIAVL